MEKIIKLELHEGQVKKSFCLHRERLLDLIYIASKTFKWLRKCDLLRMENQSILKLEAQL